jgi:hypothetical protein
MNQDKFFIINYSEWLDWINTLKHYRVNKFNYNLNSSKNFSICMFKSLHEKYYDDSAYIIVELLSDWNNNCVTKLLGKQKIHCLDLAAVDKFYPVSERGARLLRSDAERAGVVLGEPIFEAYWRDWLGAMTLERSDWKGVELARLLVGSPPDLPAVPGDVHPFLLMDQPFPQSETWSRLDDGPFNAWARAAAVLDWFLRREGHVLPSAFHEKFVSISDELRPKFDYNISLLENKSIFKCAKTCLKKDSKLYILLCVVIYYTLKFKDDGLKLLPIFVNDLSILKKCWGKALAANAAYFVGARLDDRLLAHLLLARQPERFAVLIRNRR